jgi:tetratricopeptide (TPR) repeat protein
MIPRHAGEVGVDTEVTQSQPSVSLVTAATHASRSAAPIVAAPDRSAALSVRMHSPVGAHVPAFGQHSWRRVLGSSRTALQYFSAAGSGGWLSIGYTGRTESPPRSSRSIAVGAGAADAEAPDAEALAAASTAPAGGSLHEEAVSAALAQNTAPVSAHAGAATRRRRAAAFPIAGVVMGAHPTGLAGGGNCQGPPDVAASMRAPPSSRRRPQAAPNPRALLLALSLLVAASGTPACSKDPKAAAEPAATATASDQAAKAPAQGAASARVLALSKPGGTTPVDLQIEAAQQLLARAPDVRDTWVALGRLWVRKARESADPGFYLNARAAAEVALDVDPGDLPAKNLVALVHLNDHKFYDALDVADRILADYPDDLMALGTRSDALLELGRIDEAARAAQKMVNLKPNLPSYSRAAYLRWLTGDAKAAQSIAWKAIDSGRDLRDPEPMAWAIVQAAMMFFQDGDYDGANAGFDKALDAFKDYPPALVGKGRYLLLAKQDAKGAAALLDRAYKLSPLVETAWLLGDAREAAGDAAGAAEAYALVVKHGRLGDPRTLAQFYATKNRDVDEAVKLAAAELKVRGGPYTDDAQAWALYRAGKLPEAREASDRALRHGTRDATLLYHAGAIRVAAGDAEGGRKLVEQALALSPRFDLTGAAEATKLLGR